MIETCVRPDGMMPLVFPRLYREIVFTRCGIKEDRYEDTSWLNILLKDNFMILSSFVQILPANVFVKIV